MGCLRRLRRSINPVKLCLENFIRSSVSKDPPRQAVAPDLNIRDLLCGIAVDPFSLGNESPYDTVVPLVRTLLTGRVRGSEVHQRICQFLQFREPGEFKSVIRGNSLEQAIDKVKKVRPSDLSENQTDMLKKMNRDILDYAMKNNESNEVAMLMHEGVKVSKPIKGDYRSVDIMVDADGYHILMSSNYRSVTLSHNHPSYFSSDDLFIFMKYPSIKSMAVVTNRGKVWYINKKDNYDDEEGIDAFFEFGRRHKDWDDRRIVRVFLREYSSMIERN